MGNGVGGGNYVTVLAAKGLHVAGPLLGVKFTLASAEVCVYIVRHRHTLMTICDLHVLLCATI